MIKDKKITVSIVSHGHGDMISALLKSIVVIEEVAQVILTLNIPEQLSLPTSEKIKIVINTSPLGFGENHNNAFNQCEQPFFCVMNPDVKILENPFPELMNMAKEDSIGVLGPLIKNHTGIADDNQRDDISLISVIKRNLFKRKSIESSSIQKYVDWVSGACMLFKSEIFSNVQGFDIGFFMYCEDADICSRIRGLGFKVAVNSAVSIMHDAQKLSHSNFKHFIWHVKSLIRYNIKHSFINLSNRNKRYEKRS